MAFATASQIRIFPKWCLRPRRKQEIFQDGVCDRVANKKFFKMAFATVSQARKFSAAATLRGSKDYFVLAWLRVVIFIYVFRKFSER